jgi:uncharacterized protein with PIN domain
VIQSFEAIGTPTLLETGIVIEARLGVDAESLLDRFLADEALLFVGDDFAKTDVTRA